MGKQLANLISTAFLFGLLYLLLAEYVLDTSNIVLSLIAATVTLVIVHFVLNPLFSKLGKKHVGAGWHLTGMSKIYAFIIYLLIVVLIVLTNG